MKYEIYQINENINYEIIEEMGDDGLNALLTADDLLARMAVPVTQFDFTYVDRSKLTKLMLSVERFIKRSRMNVNRYIKPGLQNQLEKKWIPTLQEDQKQEMISEYRIIDGFDINGYATFNEEFYNKYKDLFKRKKPSLIKYKAPKFGKGSSSCELIDDRPFTTYRTDLIDGFYCVSLNISVEEWCKIIRGANKEIKQLLQCYLQFTETNPRFYLKQLEQTFGIKYESLNAHNTYLGRRAQSMLNFAVVEYKDANKRCYWTTTMVRGRRENGYFIWEPRPELLEAAEIVLREEHFPEMKRLQ